MFIMEEALQLRKASPEQIVEILLAGSRVTGSGWSTGKASRALYQLSGVALVKPTIVPYRDLWLFAIALITDTD